MSNSWSILYDEIPFSTIHWHLDRAFKAFLGLNLETPINGFYVYGEMRSHLTKVKALPNGWIHLKVHHKWWIICDHPIHHFCRYDLMVCASRALEWWIAFYSMAMALFLSTHFDHNQRGMNHLWIMLML
jgi:hypothetical protein